MNPPVVYDSSVVAKDVLDPAGPDYHWYTFSVQLQAGGMMVLQGDGPQAADMAAWVTEPYEVNADGATDTGDFEDLAENYNP